MQIVQANTPSMFSVDYIYLCFHLLTYQAIIMACRLRKIHTSPNLQYKKKAYDWFTQMMANATVNRICNIVF